MKVKYIALPIVVILLYWLISEFSYPFRCEKKNYTIEMTYIDGYKETLVYSLPTTSVFYIQSNRGSYSLQYTDRPSEFPNLLSPKTIRNGVIRYKILTQ